MDSGMLTGVEGTKQHSQQTGGVETTKRQSLQPGRSTNRIGIERSKNVMLQTM